MIIAVVCTGVLVIYERKRHDDRICRNVTSPACPPPSTRIAAKSQSDVSQKPAYVYRGPTLGVFEKEADRVQADGVALYVLEDLQVPTIT